MHFSSIFEIGIILLFGFLGGLIAQKMKLPKIVGYITIGILIKPGILNFIPKSFLDSSEIATNLALALITFSIGGSLFVKKLRALGKQIIWITLFEAETAFLLVAVGLIFLLPYLMPGSSTFYYIALAILLAAVASPTDPTVTLAVFHEYKARGPVSDTILGVAASDDATGIMNFSVAMALAAALMGGAQYLTVNNLVLSPLVTIIGSIILGIAFGLFLSYTTKHVKNEGAQIALTMGALFTCFGTAQIFNLDALLATMCSGITLVNLSSKANLVFAPMQKYLEELIFIIFFVLAGANLEFSALAGCWGIVIIFIILRLVGKMLGVFIGSKISKAPANIAKYVGYGLIPQGGIVVGLALVVRQNPIFNDFSAILLSIVLGTTFIHEIIGPITSKMAITKAGEKGA